MSDFQSQVQENSIQVDAGPTNWTEQSEGSSWTCSRVQEAAIQVDAGGFEPPAFWLQTRRSSN